MMRGLYELFEKKTEVIVSKVPFEFLPSENQKGKQVDLEFLPLPIAVVIPCSCGISNAEGGFFFASEKPNHTFTKTLQKIATRIEQHHLHFVSKEQNKSSFFNNSRLNPAVTGRTPKRVPVIVAVCAASMTFASPVFKYLDSKHRTRRFHFLGAKRFFLADSPRFVMICRQISLIWQNMVALTISPAIPIFHYYVHFMSIMDVVRWPRAFQRFPTVQPKSLLFGGTMC
jgi:hypothetical protein